jgi:hypothetical protein
MDYQKIYYQLIDKAKNNLLQPDGYYEFHHILPQSLGGDSKKDNLVQLTGKQHFVAHRLLAKFTEGRNRCKMLLALHRFLHSKNCEFRINSREYEYIRQQAAIAISILNTGRQFSDKARENMSAAQRERYLSVPTHWRGRHHSNKTKKKMQKVQGGVHNPQFGKPRTEDEKRRISVALRGRKLSPEQVLERYARRHSTETKQKIGQSIKEWHVKRKMG